MRRTTAHFVVVGLVAALCWLRPSPATSQEAAAPPAEAARASTSAGVTPPPPVPPAVVSRDGNGRVTMRAVRIDEPIVIDGRLDERAYSAVPAVSDFVQQEPVEGAPATEKTEVWLFFDRQNIYVSARMWDTHPERIMARELRRDNRGILMDDHFAVALDTFYDQRNGFYFQTNGVGGLRDGLVIEERALNFDWNTVWFVRSGRFEHGWVTEMAIPFKSLRYRPGGEQVWGVNFRRNVRWKNEASHLTRVPTSMGGAGPARFSSEATLVGIEPPEATRNLELKPYGIASLTTDRLATSAFSNKPEGNFGGEMKYGVTKGLTLDLTYNTDFAQVEADDQQVNLTRFTLFFPEKREFFLENQGVFEFGGVRSSLSSTEVGIAGSYASGGFGRFRIPTEAPIMFFSRSIGLNGGRLIPITGGARLTGRAGKYTVGLLDIQTGKETISGSLATNFSAVRIKRDILRRSSIGMIATGRSVTQAGAGSNQVFGMDGAFNFHPDLLINTYYAQSRTDDTTGDDASYRTTVDFDNDRYGVKFEHLKVGSEFKPDIGFLRRFDFRRDYGGLRYSRRPRGHPIIRRLNFATSVDYIVNGKQDVETRTQAGIFDVDLTDGGKIDFEVTRNYELLDQPFRIARGVVLPVGGYAWDQLKARFTLGPLGKITETTVTRGGFYSGDRTEVSLGTRMDLTRHLALEMLASVNWVDLPEGSFTTKLASTRINYSLSARSFIAALLQYNSSIDSFSANVRLRWEYEPGSDLFVVYSEGRNTRGFADRDSSLEGRGLVLKFTKLFRF